MKVFISWSGDRSREVAEALRDWLPGVLQAIEPWLSSEDLPMGARWADRIAQSLQSADVGIVCVTAENLKSPWLVYEAGALSKRTSHSLVCIYTLDVPPSEIEGPLAQFQSTRAEREDTFRLVSTLNAAQSGPHLNSTVLQRVFDANWPWLEHRLAAVPKYQYSGAGKAQSQAEKLDEILELVRNLAGREQAQAREAPAATAVGPSVVQSGRKPKIFIGSSKEGLAVAEAIQIGLESVAECTVWNQSAFDLTRTAIESIVDISRGFDFAVIVFTADDVLVKRNRSVFAPRDNLVFELGLFTGALGRARTFLVYSKDETLDLPSDLSGVTAATYATRSDGNLEAALGPVCTRIKRAMGLLGMTMQVQRARAD